MGLGVKTDTGDVGTLDGKGVGMGRGGRLSITEAPSPPVPCALCPVLCVFLQHSIAQRVRRRVPVQRGGASCTRSTGARISDMCRRPGSRPTTRTRRDATRRAARPPWRRRPMLLRGGAGTGTNLAVGRAACTMVTPASRPLGSEVGFLAGAARASRSMPEGKTAVTTRWRVADMERKRHRRRVSVVTAATAARDERSQEKKKEKEERGGILKHIF